MLSKYFGISKKRGCDTFCDTSQISHTISEFAILSGVSALERFFVEDA